MNVPRRWMAIALLGAVVFQSAAGLAEQERKVKTRANPVYPELAKQMNVEGTVKIQVVIATDGSIRTAKALGGHPLLIQCVTEALKKWRYEPGPETTTVIEFRFHND